MNTVIQLLSAIVAIWGYFEFERAVNPFAPAAKRLSDRPENLHMGRKKIKNKNTF